MRLFAMLLAIITSLAARSAHACDQVLADPRFLLDVVKPADGAADVPIDAVVFVGSRSFVPDPVAGTTKARALPVTLVDVEGGANIDGAQSLLTSPTGAVAVFTPTAPLQPQHTYRVLVDDVSLSVFTSGDGAATGLPLAPIAALRSTHGYVYAAYSCDSQPAGADFDIDAPGAALVVTNLSASLPVIPPLAGGLEAIAAPGPQFVSQRSDDETMRVRFASLDQAGRLSPFTDVTTVDLPAQGCTCASSSSPVAPLAVALCSLALRRRRRKRS